MSVELDALTGYSWDKDTITFGFSPNVPDEVKPDFREAAQVYSDYTVLNVVEAAPGQHIDSLISMREDNLGFLALAYFPPPSSSYTHDISGDIFLSPQFLEQPDWYKKTLSKHEAGHAWFN